MIINIILTNVISSTCWRYLTSSFSSSITVSTRLWLVDNCSSKMFLVSVRIALSSRNSWKVKKCSEKKSHLSDNMATIYEKGRQLNFLFFFKVLILSLKMQLDPQKSNALPAWLTRSAVTVQHSTKWTKKKFQDQKKKLSINFLLFFFVVQDKKKWIYF